MAFTWWDDDLVRAIVVARHSSQPARECVASVPDWDKLHVATSQRAAGLDFGHLAADHDSPGQLDVRCLLDRALGPFEFLCTNEIRQPFGRKHPDFEIIAG